MSVWSNLAGTVRDVFKIGLNKASLDASGLTAARTFTLPDTAGTLALINSTITNGDTTHSPDGNSVFDALALKQYLYWGQATGTANALAVTLTPTLTIYTDATLIRVRPTLDNTSGTVTINVDGLGATPIKKNGGVALDIGDIQALRDMFLVYYDSGLTQWFELLNPAYDANNFGVSAAAAMSRISTGF